MLPIKIGKSDSKNVKLAVICRWGSNESTNTWFWSTATVLYTANEHRDEAKSNVQHCGIVEVDLQRKYFSQKSQATDASFTQSYILCNVAEAHEQSRSRGPHINGWETGISAATMQLANSTHDVTEGWETLEIRTNGPWDNMGQLWGSKPGALGLRQIVRSSRGKRVKRKGRPDL